MISFRVGQHWQREAVSETGPRDEFALELEGLNLLPGANDEPLAKTVLNLADAVVALVDGERAGQVSLEHLELCFWRTRGVEVALSVIGLSQPPKQLRAPVTIELPALVEATVACARAFLRDMTRHRAGVEAELVILERRLRHLTTLVIEPLPSRAPKPWSDVHSAAEGLGFSLRDDDGRTLAWTRKTRAGLPPLLFDGELTLPDGTHAAGLPFLTMMGLAKAASSGSAKLGTHRLRAEAVFRTGVELCLSLRARNPALSANPFVEALQIRCINGLTALRKPVPETRSKSLPKPRATPDLPLSSTGEVRRVTLQPRWSRPVALGEDSAKLELGSKFVVVHSPGAAHAFTKKGETAFRHTMPRGVGIDGNGSAVLANDEWIYGAQSGHITWLRNHDASRVGARLLRIDDVDVVTLARRVFVGLSATTGRELWRFEPPRSQVTHLCAAGSRLLIGTDEGTLYGLDAADGTVRFRVKAGLPVVQAPLLVRKRALIVLGRGEHTAIYACEALASGKTTPAGAVAWQRELILSTPGAPVEAKGTIWLGGARDGRTVIVSLNTRGQVRWEKNLNLDARTLRLLPFEGGVIACDARGSVTRLLPDGSPDWVLGSSGDELITPLSPLLRRKTLVVPGPLTRLVDPRSGRVLAELPTGARVMDLAADSRLNLYVLREPGTLETFAAASTFSVVSRD